MSLHQQDNWFLNPMSMPPPSVTTWVSWIHHECGYIPGLKKYALMDVRKECCAVCKEPIPDEIFTLWKLHNWNMLHCIRGS